MPYLDLLAEYNQTPCQDYERQFSLLQKMFAEVGEGTFIQPPFNANWGGRYVHLGKAIYANFKLTLVDDGEIFIGDHVMIGPNVTIDTATHPISPDLRLRQAQYNLPVKIGRNAWIGAGSIILPGVEIGENTVVGAGSLVTKSLPANVLAYGSPCRVIRAIEERDLEIYDHDKKIDL